LQSVFGIFHVGSVSVFLTLIF